MQSPSGVGDNWSNYLVIALLAVAAVYIVPLWLIYADIEVWRHDAAYYLNSYTLKLKSEGRWLNYYLFDLLKSVNPYLSAALHIVFLSIFLFRAAYDLGRDRLYAGMVTLVCIANATIYIQLLWPVTTLPSFAVLALAALCYRIMPAALYFTVFGALFFGTMGHLYFILPLLFCADYLDRETPTTAQARRLVIHLLIPWIAGYILGYLIATLAVYLETGQAEIVLAQWREPHPVSDVDSLLTNILRATDYLVRDTLTYLHMLGWMSLFVLVISGVSYARRRQLFHLWIPLAVMLGLYVSTIPYGINLSFRTSMMVWFGMVFIFLVIPRIGRVERAVYATAGLMILVLTVPYSKANLNWYRRTTSFYLEELQGVSQNHPQEYRGLLFVSDTRKYPQVEDSINAHLQLAPTVGILTMGTAPRWIAVARQAGFSTVRLCTGTAATPLCQEAELALSQSSRRSPGGLYRASTTESGWLAVRLNSDFPAE